MKCQAETSQSERRARDPSRNLRQISSKITAAIKVLATAWFLLFGVLSAIALFGFDDSRQTAVFVALWLIGSLLLLPRLFLVNVHLADSKLILTRFGKRMAVELSAIKGIGHQGILVPETITLHFSEETAFGRRVTFAAPIRSGVLFVPHPLIEELRSKALSEKSDGKLPVKKTGSNRFNREKAV